ncbi:type IVB secretion system protein IcmH/DotU [Variovorax sp. YR752]|uniref:type IVB secretion system protein IcmH/DotU n=1 Tax=Variovorax sp. YR752 TaxID=1884383 RepID=UPI0031382A59
MSLRKEFALAAYDHFEQLAQRLAAPVTPKPQTKPLLTSPQTLARQSPQPDRLVAIRAARVPLLEAARPLLVALAHMPRQLDVAHALALHGDLAGQVTSFQSVCADARVRQEYIAGVSYTLCTALDEAAGLSARAIGTTVGANLWSERQLAVQFHGDARGGENVFKLVAALTKNPAEHIDLLELLLIVVALGFEGLYRKATNGKRVLDDIRHTLFSTVRSCRGDDVPVAYWNAVESLLWGRVPPGKFADTAQELFQ